jgi:hypothetical protein
VLFLVEVEPLQRELDQQSIIDAEAGAQQNQRNKREENVHDFGSSAMTKFEGDTNGDTYSLL